jgi:hypothetical protein
MRAVAPDRPGWPSCPFPAPSSVECWKCRFVRPGRRFRSRLTREGFTVDAPVAQLSLPALASLWDGTTVGPNGESRLMQRARLDM